MNLTDWIVAVSSGVTALATVLLVVATVGLVLGAFAAWQTAKSTLDQMQKDSKAQTRPYLHARIEYSMGHTQGADLVIRNTGKTAAREVMISVDDMPDRSDDVIVALEKMMDTPQTLPPNVSIRSYWNLDVTGLHKEGNLGVQIPTVMHLRYRGDRYDEWFEESFPLDVTTVGMTPIGWKGRTRDNQGPFADRLNDVVRAISELRRNQ